MTCTVLLPVLTFGLLLLQGKTGMAAGSEEKTVPAGTAGRGAVRNDCAADVPWTDSRLVPAETVSPQL